MGGEPSLNDYKRAFDDFDFHLKNINDNKVSQQENQKGYLVNNEEYQKLKNEINNLYNKQQKPQNIPNIVYSNQLNNDFKNIVSKKLKTENLNEVKTQISNGSSFIIINKELHKLICDQNEPEKDYHKIEYKIIPGSPGEIVLSQGKDNIRFKKINNDNIIGPSSILGQKITDLDNSSKNINNNPMKVPAQNIEKWIIIYRNILDYYNNETFIIKSLNNKEPTQFRGFLVNNEWVDKWKKYSFYDSIKEKIIINNISDENNIQNFITLKQTESQLNYDEIYNIQNFIITDENQILEIPKTNKSYALLDKKFLDNFINTLNINQISFDIYNHIIKAKPFGKPEIIFPTNNNIINANNSSNNLNINQSHYVSNSEFLMHLLKFPFFKNDLTQKKFSQINLAKSFLLKKAIIDKLKLNFSLKEVFNFLDNNKFLKGINYENFDLNYSKISNILNNYQATYINNIKKYDTPGTIQLNKNEISLNIKNIFNKINTNYVDDFEIIDIAFGNFLNRIFENDVKLYESYYANLENKIFLSININQINIYEIVSCKTDGNYDVEYLIEILKNELFTDIYTLNSYLIQILTKYNFQDLISRNPIVINDKFTFNINSVKENIGQSFNQIQDINSNQKNNNINNKKSLLQNPHTTMNLRKITSEPFREVNKQALLYSVNKSNQDFFSAKNQQNKNQIPIGSTPSYSSPLLSNLSNIDNNIYYDNGINKNKLQGEMDIPNFKTDFPKKSNIMTKSFNPVFQPLQKVEENFLIDNLNLAINIIKEMELLLYSINQPYLYKKGRNNNYYLINKNYINQVKSLFHLDDISKIMKKNQGKNDGELLNIVKMEILKNNKMDKLTKENIQNILDSKEICELNQYFVNNDYKTNLLYYKNCDIISQKLFGLLINIDKNINKKVQVVDCIFDSNKIVIFIKTQIINIAHYNNEIIVEYIILSNGQYNNFNLQQIFGKINENGYINFMKKYNFSNLINFTINYQNYPFNVQANIYKLAADGKTEYIPSNKLKVMILLSVYQNSNLENIPQKIYLMNPDWLKQYEYKKLKNMIDNNFNKIKTLGTLSYDLNSSTKITQYLDKDKLKKYDQDYYSKASNNNLHFNCVPNQINKDLHIFFCKQFILINEELYKLFHLHYGISLLNMDISYIKKARDGDIIIIKNYPINLGQNQIKMQNLIFSGIINLNQNKFIIQHIFEYKDKAIFDKESELFLRDNISNYIDRKTFLNNNEYFSPIFENNQIIGNYYKYKESFDYKKCFNYYQYFKNKQLLNLVYLYCNELSIKNKLKNPNCQDEYFYFIKKKILSDIKEENNFDKLKDYLSGKIVNIPPSEREIYQVIRTFPQNDLPYLKNDFKPIYIQNDQLPAYEVEAEMITNPNNKSESFMIFRDFELIDRNIKNNFIDNKIPCQDKKCNFVPGNRIIIHYPINKFNKNYMCVISKIDEIGNFLNEYLLIYKKEKYFVNYFNDIKYNLDNFLKSLSFIKNIAPMTTSNYKEIGYVIKLLRQPPDPEIPLVITDITKDFLRKPLIGFENIGATCYMNATLQCLCNIKKFAEYFKYNKHLIQIYKNDTNKEKLCSAFKILLDNSYPVEFSQNYQIYLSQNPNKPIYSGRNISKTSYAPENFKETISRMNPLFEGVAANDAKDLVNFLLMTLHEELNIPIQNQVDNNNGNMFMDQTNQLLMFNKFIQNFAQNYRSVISDLFYALNCNITQCGNCQKISYNYQIYFFLIFPLEEVRKYKLQNNNQFMNNNFNNFGNNMVNNIVDIFDCFTYEQKINFMGGENAMFCNYCRQTCGSSMRTLLTTGPKILIIILNRGKGIEFNVKINFYQEINLNNYIENKNLNWQYELFGVITHIGKSDMGGHFIAYCKEFWTNRWLKYNDALVSPVNDFKSEVIDFAMPYLLFYQIKE